MRRIITLWSILALFLGGLCVPSQAIQQLIKQSTATPIPYLLTDSATGAIGQTGQAGATTITVARSGGVNITATGGTTTTINLASTAGIGTTGYVVCLTSANGNAGQIRVINTVTVNTSISVTVAFGGGAVANGDTFNVVSFVASAGTINEIGNGNYNYIPTTAEDALCGILIIHVVCPSCTTQDYSIQVVAFDPASATNLGLSALPTAAAGANGGLPTGDSTGKVTFNNTNIATVGGLGPPANWNNLGISSGGALTIAPLAGWFANSPVGSNPLVQAMTGLTAGDGTVGGFFKSMFTGGFDGSNFLKVNVQVNADKTGYALTSGEHTQITGVDIPTGLNSNGYTTTRAGYLDKINVALPNVAWATPGGLPTVGTGANQISLSGGNISLPAAPSNFLTSAAFAAGTQAPAGFLANEYAAVANAVGTSTVDQLTIRQVLSLQQALLLDAARTYNSTTHVATATWYASKTVSGAIVPDTTKPVLVKTTQYDSTDKQILSSSTALTQANL